MRERALLVSRAVLASSLLIGCTELQHQLPQDFSDLAVGPPRKHFEGVPAHSAIEPPPVAAPTDEPARATAVNASAGSAGTAVPGRSPLTDVRELIGLERHEIQDRLGDPA